MKKCELCKGKARLHCASDEAILCWDCDAKVHSANFLVARHSRNLLCHVCQSPTPWSATGAKLQSTLSVCQQCVGLEDSEEEREKDEREVVEENHLVPWSPPPPSESSSSDDEESVDGGGHVVVSRKRFRIENASSSSSSSSDEDRSSSLSPATSTAAGATDAVVSRRQTTTKRKNRRDGSGRAGSRNVDRGHLESGSLRRFHHREETDTGGDVAEFCTLQGTSI